MELQRLISYYKKRKVLYKMALYFKCNAKDRALLQALIMIIAGYFAIAFISCESSTEKEIKTEKLRAERERISIEQPKHLQLFTVGDSITTHFSLQNISDPDSIVVDFNGNKFRIEENKNSFNVSTYNSPVGTRIIKIMAYKNGSIIVGSAAIVLKSDIKPVNYTYRMLHKYPHDIKLFTQGLVYDNGYIYEGTGQYGESKLLKYKLNTGELIQSYKLPDDVFGEGIVLLDNSVFQLTWQSGVAFQFDRETFQMTNKFIIQTEGWGITNYKDKFIMSDGSNILYVLNPGSFDVVKRIEVYDHMGPVTQLNELEYINNKIYANVYLTEDIVIINPENGKVEGRINMKGLFFNCDKQNKADVLNGIAWKGEKNRLLLTGKLWSNIFYIEYLELN